MRRVGNNVRYRENKRNGVLETMHPTKTKRKMKMKKMIIVAAVSLVAGLVNAASVNWVNPSGARITGLDGQNITQANAKAWGLQAILVNTTTGEELTSYGGSTGWAKAGVPEPTSALLLLVGGAMLALRRKQK